MGYMDVRCECGGEKCNSLLKYLDYAYLATNRKKLHFIILKDHMKDCFEKVEEYSGLLLVKPKEKTDENQA